MSIPVRNQSLAAQFVEGAGFMEPGAFAQASDCDHTHALLDGGVLIHGAPDAPTPLEDLTVNDLKELADAEAIDLGDASKKHEIVAAIQAARNTEKEA